MIHTLEVGVFWRAGCLSREKSDRAARSGTRLDCGIDGSF